MKTVRQFAQELLNLREDLQSKEVVLVAKNGLCLTPEIKLELREEFLPSQGVNRVVITY